MSKTAVITGVLGQDGSYLAELLAEKGYTVWGVHRRHSKIDLSNLNRLDWTNFHLVESDLCDPSSINDIVDRIKPDEFYNLAAMSHVGSSFNQPSYTFQVNTLGPLNCLEAIRRFSPKTRFYQASTSELFGDSWDWAWREEGQPIKIQSETTAFAPRSPYAISKLAAHELVKTYREGYDLFSCSGILFNHESPRRGENFVTRKITKWIGENVGTISSKNIQYLIKANGNELPRLKLGNINAYRDWGHSKDYVRAMWLMLQQDKPKDYVIATGETRTVKDFLQAAFSHPSVRANWEDWVEIDPSLYRPAEVDYLCGDSTLARTELGWKPEISFDQLVDDMVRSDLNG